MLTRLLKLSIGNVAVKGLRDLVTRSERDENMNTPHTIFYHQFLSNGMYDYICQANYTQKLDKPAV